MSSQTLWKDEPTGVTAEWDKHACYRVRVPYWIDPKGLTHSHEFGPYIGEQQAKRAARYYARKRRAELGLPPR
jgi:hypothetical protein